MALRRKQSAGLTAIHLGFLFLLLMLQVSAFYPSHAARRHRHAHRADRASAIHYDDFLPSPHANLDAVQVVEACMNTMLQQKDAGLEVCWNFSSDRCRAALGGSLEEFRQYSTNPVFSHLVNCKDWKTISVGPIIQGTPTRGAMQTVLMDVFADDSSAPRRFLWTLQRERRPPRQGCFLVHECIYVRNAYDLTL